jgi:acyl dehydratase
MGTGTLQPTEAKEGLEAPVKEITLGRTDLAIYAGASGDFNPVHHDEVFAKSAGQPSVFGHGMFSMGLLGTALTDFVGIGNVRSFGVRFVKQTWPGEVLRTKIVITDVSEKDGKTLVTMECSLENADGEVKVTGDATAVLT